MKTKPRKLQQLFVALVCCLFPLAAFAQGTVTMKTTMPIEGKIFMKIITSDDSEPVLDGLEYVRDGFFGSKIYEVKKSDITITGKIKELHCQENSLTSLSFSNCTELTTLLCTDNKLTTLDISGLPVLTALTCFGNPLTSLDLSGCKTLLELDCFQCKLTSLNLANCTALTKVVCSENELSSIDVTGCTSLIALDCSTNNFEELNLTGCNSLMDLNCSSNNLTSLNFSGWGAGLRTLFCHINRLKSLDVSNCPEMGYLSCYSNNLTSLDLSKNTKLNFIDICTNQIKGENMTAFVNSLPITENGEFLVIDKSSVAEQNRLMRDQALIAKKKGWLVKAVQDGNGYPYDGEGAEDNTITGFGYADRTTKRGEMYNVGSGKVGGMLAFIELSNLGGDKLKGITFYTNKSESKGCIFLLDENYKVIALKKEGIADGYNKIAFDTPIALEKDKKYFVGYQIYATAKQLYPILFDQKEAIVRGTKAMLYEDALTTGTTLDKSNILACETMGVGTLMVFADIEDTEKHIEKVALILSSKGGDKVKPNEKQAVTLKVRNIGSTAIAKTAFSVKIGDAAEQTITVDTNLDAGATSEVSLNIDYPASGMGNVIIKIAQLDGKENLFLQETSFPYIVVGEGTALKNTVLIEQFTGEKCPNCPAAKPILEGFVEALTKGGYKVSYIQHHAGYYEDFLTLPESNQLLDYVFGNRGSFAPAFTLDRIVFQGEVPAVLPSKASNEEVLKVMKESVQIGAITSVEQSYQGNKLKVIAKGTIDKEFDPNNLYITAVVTEDNIESKQQQGAPLDYIHNHVPRVYLSPFNGEKATVNNGEFTITFEAKTIDSEWKKEDMKVVLFGIKKMDEKNLQQFKQREVLFSTNVPLEKPSATATIAKADEPVVLANDGYLTIKGLANAIEVYDLNGVLVTKEISQRLDKGVYVVRVLNDFGTFVSKVIVR